MGRYRDWILAMVSGAMLGVMININSGLAWYSTPFVASWVVHGVGAVVALVLLQANVAVAGKGAKAQVAQAQVARAGRPPLWSYLGGAPGALAVALGSISVNSSLALSGALSLMLVGQIVFSLVSDFWGLFGAPQRRLTRYDLIAACLVVAGSALLIFSRET